MLVMVRTPSWAIYSADWFPEPAFVNFIHVEDLLHFARTKLNVKWFVCHIPRFRFSPLIMKRHKKEHVLV